jgi:hypothetical protein
MDSFTEERNFLHCVIGTVWNRFRMDRLLKEIFFFIVLLVQHGTGLGWTILLKKEIFSIASLVQYGTGLEWTIY